MKIKMICPCCGEEIEVTIPVDISETTPSDKEISQIFGIEFG